MHTWRDLLQLALLQCCIILDGAQLDVRNESETLSMAARQLLCCVGLQVVCSCSC